MFSNVTEYIDQNPRSKTDKFTGLVTEHLMKMEEEINSYFPSLDGDEFVYLRNPFSTDAQVLQAGTGRQEELVEMQHDDSALHVYSEKNLCDFWFSMRNSYRQIVEPAIRALLVFPSTWLCESAFSVLLGIKEGERKNQRF